MQTKVCTKCGEEKLVSEFTKTKRTKDGYYSSCKLCRKKFRIENKEKIRAKNKKYYESNKERINERQKEYNRVNRKIVNKRKREYLLKNPHIRKKCYKTHHKKESEELRDSYIKKIILNKKNWYVKNGLLDVVGIKSSLIPQFMIDDKRAELKLYRKIKQLKNEQKKS